MHPEDLMKPDLFSEIVLLRQRWPDIRFTIADHSDLAHASLTWQPFGGLCPQPFRSVQF